ncbi:hypothetical protein B4168_2329 [Anoxybacillus flavithermus]|nr:hypothetical protein B4168_2329 [Anoxybacillus flavithermus]OAO87753.1 hypothetical protein GT23_0900 [Parageobacillus thermoglucosidasius]
MGLYVYYFYGYAGPVFMLNKRFCFCYLKQKNVIDLLKKRWYIMKRRRNQRNCGMTSIKNA